MKSSLEFFALGLAVALIPTTVMYIHKIGANNNETVSKSNEGTARLILRTWLRMVPIFFLAAIVFILSLVDPSGWLAALLSGILGLLFILPIIIVMGQRYRKWKKSDGEVPHQK